MKNVTDTATLGLLGLALYSVTAQSALHGDDVHALVSALEHGTLKHDKHVLYLWLMDGLWALLRPLGLDALDTLQAGSVLGGAVAMALLHRAALGLGLDRGRAALVTGYWAVCPGVLFFATVEEIHGVFLPFAALTFLAFAARTGAAARGALTGAASGLASSAHATGHLLAVLLVLWFWGRASAPRRLTSTVQFGLGLALTHGLAAAAVTAIFSDGAPAFGSQLGFALFTLPRTLSLTDHLEPLRVAWREGFLPLLPLSVGAVAALLRPSLRREAAIILLATLVYLGATYLVLLGAYERGAYLLPLAFPAAWLTLRAVGSRRANALLLALAATLSVGWHVAGDRPLQDPALASGMTAHHQQEKFFLWCAGRRELDTLVCYRVPVPASSVHHLGFAPQLGITYEMACHAFEMMLRDLRNADQALLISDDALAVLRRGGPVLGRLANEYLPARYELERVENGAFVAHRVVPRAR
ncbi:MAG: hypothetical protein AAF628_34740 [Planctomycetota bacterium]